MKINTNSWHYKVFESTYTIFGKSAPWQSNLCQYVQRTFFFSWVFYLAAALMYLWFFMVLTPPALLFGARPTRRDMSSSYSAWIPGWGFRHYNGWQVFSELEIYPWMVIAPILFIAFNIFSIHNACLFGWHAALSIVFLGVEIGLMCFLAYILFGAELTQDTREVLGSWLAAKKQKVCPLVSFTDGTNHES